MIGKVQQRTFPSGEKVQPRRAEKVHLSREKVRQRT
jgi:hypothetical protein